MPAALMSVCSFESWMKDPQQAIPNIVYIKYISSSLKGAKEVVLQQLYHCAPTDESKGI